MSGGGETGDDPLAGFAALREHMDRAQAEAHEALARLNARGVRGECPMCGNDRWHLFYPNSRLVLSRSEGGTYDVEAYTLICSNCGLTRQHAKGFLGPPPPPPGVPT